MRNALTFIKAALLLGALVIAASSALPSTAQASAENCAGDGHTCHFVADGVVQHSKAQTAL